MKTLVTIVMLLSAAFAQAAEVADYRFDGDFESSIAGAPALQEIAPLGGVFAPEPALGRTAWLFPAGRGLSFDATGLVSAEYTMLLQIRSTLEHQYVKLIDTSDLVADYGLYFSFDDLGFYPRAYGDDNTLLTPDQYYTVVVTRTAAGLYTGYIDGEQRFQFIDEAGEGIVPPSGQVALLRDDTTTSEAETSEGAIARFRVFDTALTVLEVQAISNSFRIFRSGFER